MVVMSTRILLPVLFSMFVFAFAVYIQCSVYMLHIYLVYEEVPAPSSESSKLCVIGATVGPVFLIMAAATVGFW